MTPQEVRCMERVVCAIRETQDARRELCAKPQDEKEEQVAKHLNEASASLGRALLALAPKGE